MKSRSDDRHRIDNVQLNIRLDAEMDRRIAKAAAEKKMTKKDFVSWTLWNQVNQIQLNEHDYQAIREGITRRATARGLTQRDAVAAYDELLANRGRALRSVRK